MTLPLNMDRRALMSLAAGSVGALALRAQTAPRDFGPNASPVRYPDPDILTLDPRFKKYAIGNAPIQRVATGFLWAEGPAWNGVGRYLMWSDIPNDRQMRLLDEDGHVSVLRKPAGFSNGNTFDGQGRQISCEHGNRRVVRYEYDGTFTVLAKVMVLLPEINATAGLISISKLLSRMSVSLGVSASICKALSC